MRKLYVGNIDFGTTEDDLKTHFEQYGEVEDVNIHKFHDTGRSRGFGFITFINSSGVDNVQMCRPHLLQGNTLDTKRALPKGENNSQDDVRVKKIFIGAPEDEKHAGGHSGLSDDIEDEDLNNYFSQYGVVVKIDQLRWKDSGKKRGYGYIEFDDEDTVDKVCLIGIHEVLGVRLEVKKAVEKHSLQKTNTGQVVKEVDSRGAKRSRKEQVDPESKVMRKVFIGNLNLSTTEENLKEYFEQFGSTELVQLPLHVDSGKSRGFAFITFEKASSVDATQGARPHKLDGSFIETTRATPKQDLGNPEAEAKVKKIFIGGANDEKVSGHSGLTDDISDEDLEDYFGQFGVVTKVEQKVWEDSGKKRGYGYIEFDDEDSVDKIVLLGIHTVKGVRLEAKKGLNKDQLKTKAGGGMNYGNRMGRMGSVGPVGGGGNNMGGGMQNNMKSPGFGSFMPNRGENNMGNMMGQMQSMMGSMNSGNMDKSNMMGNMEQMQKMMGNMQNNMGSGGMGSENNMQMMQNMMNMQNMMGSMQKNNGNPTDQSMAMMTSMQQMMMNMMSMCTQMMSQGMNNSPASGNTSSFSGQGNSSSMQRGAGSGFPSSSHGSSGSSAQQTKSSPGYSSQGNTNYGNQGMNMNSYSGYGSSPSGGSYSGSASQGANRYSTGTGMGQGSNSYYGMGNSGSRMGQGTMNYSGMGQGGSMGQQGASMGQQGASGYSGMGNSARGGGPVRGDMGANRGNPYARN